MTPAEREELSRALDCIHPDLPRDEWIAVLMGLHSACWASIACAVVLY
jgi:hypothetical protein